MSQVVKHLRTFLLAQEPIARRVGLRIHEGRIPQGFPVPAIWYRRASTRHERALNEDGVAPFSETFDVEIWCDERREADEIADLIRELDGHDGTFGDLTIQNFCVDEQQDDYAPLNAAGDVGENVASLSVEVIP